MRSRDFMVMEKLVKDGGRAALRLRFMFVQEGAMGVAIRSARIATARSDRPWISS
jgi:hypothetical protein